MIIEDVEGSCVVWTLDRPSSKNALHTSVLKDIETRARALASNTRVRCLILTGAGDMFASGGDLNELGAYTTEADAAQLSTLGNAACLALEHLPFPVIAAINGPALGGGVELALACDIRVMNDSTYLSFRHVRLGVMTSWGTLERLTRSVSYSRAMLAISTGANLSADEALRAGLVEQVAADALACAKSMAADIAKGSPTAIQTAKAAMRAGYAQPSRATQLEREAFIKGWTSSDHAKAVSAFLAKEKCTYPDRKATNE